MLDLNKIRKETERIKELLSGRGRSYSEEIDRIKQIDEKWRESLAEIEELKRKKNAASKEIGNLNWADDIEFKTKGWINDCIAVCDIVGCPQANILSSGEIIAISHLEIT